MGLFSFIGKAGKAIGIGDDTDEAAAAADAKIQELRAQRMQNALKTEISELGLGSSGLDIGYTDGKVTVTGSTENQADREKIILALGNVKGVSSVDDRITVNREEPEAVFYTVESGDTLSKIAKEHYGNAGKYNVIYEANRPMLQDPDKIYPGQTLRIPPLAE